MYNELTEKDIQMMKAELDHRRIELRPKLLEAVKEARGFGDLSENFEYKAAKQEKNRNESRIRFLENMIKTARVIRDTSGEGHHRPAGRLAGAHQQGVACGQGPAGPESRGAGPYPGKRGLWL